MENEPQCSDAPEQGRKRTLWLNGALELALLLSDARAHARPDAARRDRPGLGRPCADARKVGARLLSRQVAEVRDALGRRRRQRGWEVAGDEKRVLEDGVEGRAVVWQGAGARARVSEHMSRACRGPRRTRVDGQDVLNEVACLGRYRLLWREIVLVVADASAGREDRAGSAPDLAARVLWAGVTDIYL